MGSTHAGYGPDPRWAVGLAALGAKAAAKAAQSASRSCATSAREDFPGFAWIFGGGPGPAPWGGHGGGPRGRGPWGQWGKGPWGPRARKGNVRAAILALLAEEPRNGYQIIQEINERSGGGWKPSPGAVYPALQQLADEGLIRGEESEGRKSFHITDAGRAYVDEHADEVRAPWEAMTPDFGEGVPDLFRQAAQTGAAVMQVVHTGSADQINAAKEVLAETRRSLYRILAEESRTDDGDDDR